MSNDFTDPFSVILRQAAMRESKTELAYALRASADLIENLIEDVSKFGSAAALRDLNGAWAYGSRLLELHRNPSAPPPKAIGVPTTGARRT